MNRGGFLHLARLLLVGELTLGIGSPGSALGASGAVSLSECVRMAVTDNLDLVAKRLRKDEAQLSLPVVRKIIIPRLAVETRRTLARGERLEYDASLVKKGLDGTEYRVAVDGGQTLDPSAGSLNEVTFNLTRPLLRNFGVHITGFELDLARVDADLAIELFRAELDEFVSGLAEVYYDLFFATRNHGIQQQAYERAVRQYTDTKNDIEKGALAQHEIYLVEGNVIRYDVKRQEARRDIALRQMALSSLLNLPVDGDHRLEPSQAMRREGPRPEPLADAIGRMTNRNPNYRTRVLSLDRSRINHDYYRNQVLPVLDVLLEHTISTPFPGVRDNETTAGLRFEIPLSRSADRAQAARYRLKNLQDRASLGDLKTTLSYELRKLQFDLRQQEEILKLKTKATGLSQAKLDAEMEKYRNGITTLVETVRFQQDLEGSSIDETQALVAFNKLILRKLKIEGTLSESFGIVIRKVIP